MKNDSDSGDRAIGRVVIVGGGTAGWMTAAALSRMLNDGRRTFTLIESDQIGTVGVGEATIPPLINFNQMLEINENDFLRATQGTIKLGIDFRNWGRIGDRYFHPFGAYGHDLHGIPFHQLWLRENEQGRPGDISEYCMSAMAGLSGKFARPSRDRESPLARLFYAFHFDASLYARFLRDLAERQGTVRREGKVVDVERNGENGDVIAVTLESGERIEGDFFIDCSGFRALLIEQTLGAGFEEWSHWLPMNRAIAARTANVTPPDPYTRATAHGAGWQWRIPLQHRTGTGHVYASDYISDDEARAVLLANIEGDLLEDPWPLRFTAGRRKTTWSHNVVAIGLASGFLEPLESTSIHLIQNGILRLLTLFPDRRIAPVERDEYNKGMREAYEDIRDFIILHYKCTQRDDTALWRRVRDMEIPESLQRRLELWRLHARIFREGAELFGVTSWVAVLLGQNIWPEHYDPVADSLDEAKVRQAMQKMREDYRRTAQAMPSQEQFLRMAGAWGASDVPASITAR